MGPRLLQGGVGATPPRRGGARRPRPRPGPGQRARGAAVAARGGGGGCHRRVRRRGGGGGVVSPPRSVFPPTAPSGAAPGCCGGGGRERGLPPAVAGPGGPGLRRGRAGGGLRNGPPLPFPRPPPLRCGGAAAALRCRGGTGRGCRGTGRGTPQALRQFLGSAAAAPPGGARVCGRARCPLGAAAPPEAPFSAERPRKRCSYSAVVANSRPELLGPCGDLEMLCSYSGKSACVFGFGSFFFYKSYQHVPCAARGEDAAGEGLPRWVGGFVPVALGGCEGLLA